MSLRSGIGEKSNTIRNGRGLIICCKIGKRDKSTPWGLDSYGPALRPDLYRELTGLGPNNNVGEIGGK